MHSAGTIAALALALGGASGTVRVEDAVVFSAPRAPAEAPIRLRAPLPESGDDEGRVWVEVVDFDAIVHENTARSTWGAGVLRRGAVLPATRAWARGCGRWAKLDAGGFVCSGDGVAVHDDLREPKVVTIDADRGSALPFRYAKIAAAGTPRFGALPSGVQRARAALGQTVEGIDYREATGINFVAIDRSFVRDGRRYLRTVSGEFIPADAVEPVVPPATMGQQLIHAKLPLAFVVEDDVTVWRTDGDSLEVVGRAERTARFEVGGNVKLDDAEYVETRDGLLIDRAAVRVVRTIPQPSEARGENKWIHVDLDEQVLVAYEDGHPVFATLVATGIPGFDTPEGDYRVRRKYVSRTMSGPDPDKGTYEIEEVPWTLYYHGGLALHGAYWHDEFGKVRSHGCTNLPPSAARWLFHWVDPEVPEGWQGVHEAGTLIYFTRD